jgi:hypothetical protein
MDCRVKPGNDDAERREATSGSGMAGFTIGPGFRSYVLRQALETSQLVLS